MMPKLFSLEAQRLPSNSPLDSSAYVATKQRVNADLLAELSRTGSY